MASSSSVKGDFEVTTDIEPGACTESILATTDSFEDFATQMSSSLEDKKPIRNRSGTISEIQHQVGDDTADGKEGDLKTAKSSDDLEALKDEETEDSKVKLVRNVSVEEQEDLMRNPEWAGKDKHLFILSSAGKPIYTRHGNEDKLTQLCALIQALVNFVQEKNDDVLRSINVGNSKAVFLVKGPLILAMISKKDESETQIILQLTYAYNQIVSVLTQTQLTKLFDRWKNYDLRRLLSGTERLIDHLLTFMEEDPAFLLGAVRCLPLPSSTRDTITSTIISACSKIKDLVFAILLAGNQLITMVRMRKYTLHPSDIHLLFNFVRSSESFKTAESWTPVCLPKFDATGFLHGHISYISDDCQACLLLLTVQRDAFFTLSQAKHTITEKLRRSNCFLAINESINRSKELSTSEPLKHINVPEMRHFMYKCKSTAQLFTSHPVPLDNCVKSTKRDCDMKPKSDAKDKGVGTDKGDGTDKSVGTAKSVGTDKNEVKAMKKLSEMDYVKNYRKYCSQIHSSSRPARLIYKTNSDETILAWVTSGFELYTTLDALVDKHQAIVAVDKLLRWIKKEEERIFIMNAPTF